MRIKLSLVACAILVELRIQKLRSKDFRGISMSLKGKSHG